MSCSCSCLLWWGPSACRDAYLSGRASGMRVYAAAVLDEFMDEIDYLDEQYKTIGEVDQAKRGAR